MRIIKLSAAAMLAALTLAGCSGLAAAPSVQSVRVVGRADVGKCLLVGHATVSLVDQLDAVKDDPAKERQVLELLARRSAVTLDGNAVVAAGPVKAGGQVFDIYRCGGR